MTRRGSRIRAMVHRTRVLGQREPWAASTAFLAAYDLASDASLLAAAREAATIEELIGITIIERGEESK